MIKIIDDTDRLSIFELRKCLGVRPGYFDAGRREISRAVWPRNVRRRHGSVERPEAMKVVAAVEAQENYRSKPT